MKQLVLALLFLVPLQIISAQTTYQILWKIGINDEDASLDIETGDTVEWIWDDTFPHTVTNKSGSTETFDSGSLTGEGSKYSKTFNLEGANPYECEFHPGMDGVITVSNALSVDDNALIGFTVVKNPAREFLTLKFPTTLTDITLTSFNVMGQRMQVSFELVEDDVLIDISKWQQGLYFIKAQSGNLTQTKRFIKQ
ncbi:T9SS type A sorting domain-containing protein [Aegicerativicinus sediminis]|uniref:T9SS type A sorting domain-containing protein n=1 Tax=Aegicerativicinus sediminis TaxID=2893202 RepID=UPI001E29581F|nr:T9SS type A sorting domain-containing protein [Aegicerativicinus sediminis]